MGLDYGYVALGLSLVALVYAGGLWFYIRRQNRGTPKMVEISDAVRQGAGAFLSREYKVIAPIAVIIVLLIFGLIDYPNATGGATAAGFAIGAFLSALAGYIGMAVTVRTSSRTAEAAKSGLGSALTMAFRGGGVMGMTVVGLDLFGLSVFYLAFSSTVLASPATLAGLGFGASLIAMFMRVSGGIYTKAADVGADLVGKVEAGIPEDDPRNPAVIADNVGDNVGDCAGMGADVYESYVVTTIAVMILGALISSGASSTLLVYPLLLGAAGVVGAVAGSFYVRKSIKSNPLRALNITLMIAAVVTVIFDFVFGQVLFNGSTLGYYLFASAIVGIVVVVAIENVANYFTSYAYAPVREIALSSQTGAATNFLSGFSTGLTSAAPSAVVLVVAIIASYSLGYAGSTGAESARVLTGIYSTAVATMSMLSLTGIIMSIDSFGPITDNANGIVEMAGLESSVRTVTDELDALGNTTKATTKAFAVTSAALAAVAIFEAFQHEASRIILANASAASRYASSMVGGQLQFSLSDPYVVIGLLIGGLLPFYFSSFLIKAVGRAAYTIVNEVRRQFKEIPGIMEGTAKPDYAKAVGISTSAAIRELAKPGALAVITPLVVGFVLGPLALGGLLIGSVVSGVFLAFTMTNGGAAWDNAKKYIETGQLGGKGSDAHKAAVMGDTVGDPFKDTAGPAINSLIKVVNTISIVFISAIVLSAIFV
ncbi:MAG: sodium-translocating pyrophosphatase [Nitrososphaerota archaeon]|nr:sodium-translocating pyrophosphatase [Nitrososphaerota archaeon]MDG7023045.1 sodium-translocating pyrophosphatase [Nitrososphaerota archaeon]